MSLQITAVDARRFPVDVDPRIPVRCTLAGVGRGQRVTLSLTVEGRDEVLWQRRVEGPHVVLAGVQLDGEQGYLLTVTGSGSGAVATHAFRTGPQGEWPEARSIWAPGEPWLCALRRRFDLPDKAIAWATLFVTAGSVESTRQYVHVTSVNGQIVGSGPTRSIGDESRFDGFDVTGLVCPGSNVIAATVGTSQGQQQFQARLVVAHEDGERVTLGTDASWRARPLDGANRADGDLGTSCYTLPAENVDMSSWPWGYELSDFDDAGWACAELRPPLVNLHPTPTHKVEHRPVRPRTVTRTGDGRVVVDFGKTWLGGLRLRTRGARGAVTVRYGERLDGDAVRYRMNSGNVYEETLLCDGTDRTLLPWGMRVFRYVEIVGLSEDLTAEDVCAIAQIYPLDPTAAMFRSSDPVLDAVWDLSAHTIRSLNGNLYVDSWTRERVVYEADVYLQQRAHLCLDADPSLGRYSTAYLTENRTWPTEWPFYTVLAVHDDWMRTGDTAHSEQVFDALLTLLPERYLEPQLGLIRKSPGSKSTLDGDLVDWPQVERHGYQFGPVNTVVNALAAAAYKAAADLAEALGRRDAQRLASTAAGLRRAIRERLFDSELGAVSDGLDGHGDRLPHHSVHASAFALWAGALDADQRRAVATHLRREGMACSVYAAAFVIDALFTHGHGHEAVNLLTGSGARTWARMLELGAGATMEAWDESIKPNLTHSHPWAASPAFLAIEGVLGVRPLTPGYRTFSVHPQLGHLDHAAGRLPTVVGAISVEARRAGPKILLVITVPPGCEAVVRHEGGAVAVRLLDGTHRVVLCSEHNEIA